MGYVSDLELGPDGQVIASPPSRPERLPEDEEDRISLCELLDRVLNKGVVVRGEIVITVADVELLYVGLELILCATETARQAGIRLPVDMTAARLLPAGVRAAPLPAIPAAAADPAGSPRPAPRSPDPRDPSDSIDLPDPLDPGEPRPGSR